MDQYSSKAQGLGTPALWCIIKGRSTNGTWTAPEILDGHSFLDDKAHLINLALSLEADLFSLISHPGYVTHTHDSELRKWH